MDDITQRHKLEVKELNAKIQALKHSVPKGDKKRKKQVTNDIAILQAQLEQRHEQEIKQIVDDQNTSHLSDTARKLSLNETEDVTNVTDTSEVVEKKISKAQKRRDKKEQEERERQKRLEEGAKETENHSRTIEAQAFSKLLSEKNWKIHEIQPDGNCMFNAILLQKFGSMSQSQLDSLREQTAQHMILKKNDFLPFATNSTTTDEPLTEDEFRQYCDDIQNTNAWGGHLELRAISQIYQQRVEIYQASSPIIFIGEECHVSPNQPLRLSYHRHQYGLGAHYNALVPVVMDQRI